MEAQKVSFHHGMPTETEWENCPWSLETIWINYLDQFKALWSHRTNMCTVLTLSTQFHENAPTSSRSSFSNTIETVPETALKGQEQVCCILWDDADHVIGTNGPCVWQKKERTRDC
jgi:hypothetical protein